MTLSETQTSLVRALADTLFTRERPPTLDGTDAHVAAWFEEWFSLLPTAQQRTFAAALGALEIAFRTWVGRADARFATSPRGERAAFLEACAESGQYHARMGFEAIRFVLLAGWADSPEVSAAIGMEDPVEMARARLAAAQEVQCVVSKK